MGSRHRRRRTRRRWRASTPSCSAGRSGSPTRWTRARPRSTRGEGVVGITFHLKEDYVRPVWPNTPGEQQMMMHLDFEVSDLAEATAYALENGAVLAEFQPQDDVRVFYDPDGHPFCLYAHGG